MYILQGIMGNQNKRCTTQQAALNKVMYRVYKKLERIDRVVVRVSPSIVIKRNIYLFYTMPPNQSLAGPHRPHPFISDPRSVIVHVDIAWLLPLPLLCPLEAHDTR